ncbi:Cupin 2, conserved barrel [Plesiocystis pacifica SIR-1]|uniref:Cupin 2, conserved barrel n=1 Tax=Plesiocystis pacifica SIR-1 TaxID=391625 RepID=A6GCM8_9BACT|nr:cupin domain-containing protein [Plesiocystis pacifica]EDM76380.1 Cupin 2, conserved barrel [Plesiocystis pacifica SIR-1]
MNTTVEDLLVLPGQGKNINDHIFITVGTEHTGGVFSAMKVTLAPHQLLAPHTHDTEDQAVYVISGEIEFEVGGEGGLRFTAPAGSFVRKPAGVEHCFWNATDTPSDYIELNAGERFQRFVEATANGAIRAAIGSDKKYGVTINYARVPGMLAKNRLTSVATMNMPWEGMAPPKFG